MILKEKQARADNRRVEMYLDAFALPMTRFSKDAFLRMMDNKFKKEELIFFRIKISNSLFFCYNIIILR